MAYRTPVYLRDMNNQIQKDAINSWKLKKKKKLLKAYNEGDDIQVGEYTEAKVVD